MNRSIYTYALIKALYDQEQDYIDSFRSFTIKVIPTDKFVDLVYIQKNLKTQFALEIPLHVLSTILKRAEREDYLEQKNELKHYKLKEKGLKYLDILETEKEVERRINSLLENIKQFFEKNGLSLNIDKIHNLLISFFQKNIENLIEFINPSISAGELSISSPDSYENILVKYIVTAEQEKPEHYKILQEMIMGSIISVVLYAKEPSDIEVIRSKKFKHCQVFLDTNFVFSILNFRDRESSESAKELLRLLKKLEFRLNVFSFTVDEICRVIGRYPKMLNRYPTSIGVDTIYSNLKIKGWKETDAKDFIVNIETILREKGVKIKWVADIDLNNYEPKNADYIDIIRQYKPLQDAFNRNHDLAAIEEIKTLRKIPLRKIEDAKAIFLTEDDGLSKFNFVELAHKTNGTVCEVILAKLLTSILWLKNPTAEVSLKAIIAAYSRELFIKRRIWDKFYDVLYQLRQEEKTDDDKISMLFYHRYIEDILRKFDEADSDQITSEFVLGKIEEAARLPEKDIKKKLEYLEKIKAEEIRKEVVKKEKEFLKCIKFEVSKKEQEKDKEWSEEIREIKKKARRGAEGSAGNIMFILRSLITVLFSIPCIFYIVKGKWEIFLRVQGAVSIIAFLLIFIFGISDIKGLWKHFEEKLADTIYNKKVKDLGLHKYN